VSKSFTYCILTYKHSLFLGEVLNVGLLLIFPDEKIVEFHYPKRLNRIKDLYGNFNERLIKDYLKAFESKASKLHQHLEKYVFGYSDLISDHFIVEDASALQFDSLRSGIYYNNHEEVSERYINLILGEYKSETIVAKHRITADNIVKNVTSKIIDINPSSKEFLKFDTNRILENKHVQFKSDFYWKNGHINHSKAISFDVLKETTIIDNALLLNAKLRHLENSKHKNAHIDLIIQAPNTDAYQDTFAEALSILNENQIEKRFYTEWTTYSELVAKEIKPL
jgi:hypothetical protein